MKVMDEKQQLLLKEFYKHEKLWGPDYYLSGFVAGILLFPAMILLIMPFQVWEGDYQVPCIIFFIELMGLEIYVKQYCEFREDGIRKGVYKIIRYVPVSYRQFVLYALKKQLKLCLCLTSVAIVCQVVFALAFLDTFSVGNLLMPLLVCLILPMLLTGIRYYSRHRSRS